MHSHYPKPVINEPGAAIAAKAAAAAMQKVSPRL
jgi:hypothetical protein